MSYEEKKEYEELKSLLYTGTLSQHGKRKLIDMFEKQQKEIEELKDDRKNYAEEYIHNNPWLYKQLNEDYILRVESEQKERKAYIKGTNDADELCNKKWENKIKAKIEECENKIKKIRNKKLINEPEDTIVITRYAHYISVSQSLLEKE